MNSNVEKESKLINTSIHKFIQLQFNRPPDDVFNAASGHEIYNLINHSFFMVN